MNYPLTNLFENGVTLRKNAFWSLLKVCNWRSSSVFGVPQTLPGMISFFYLENGVTHAVTTQTVNHHFSTFRHIKMATKCLRTKFQLHSVIFEKNMKFFPSSVN